ncbi:MAG TPA: hypothetical protein VGH66_13775 [Acidimicrobiales bacterium]
MAELPDEHLEAIIEQARRADAAGPDAVGDRLRDASRQLRQAHTAHGLALGADDPTGARMADQQVGPLIRAIARLDEAQQRRQRWRTLTARLHQQAQAALVELEARHDARNSSTRADTTLAGLRRRLAHAEGRLDSMDATVDHVQAVARRRRAQADQLAAQLAVLVAARPPPAEPASSSPVNRRPRVESIWFDKH